MLKGRDLLSIHDLSSEEVEAILALAEELKAMQKAGIEHRVLAGKTLGMIFEKSSTRTRVSFETGMFQLGGQALFLSNRDLQIGRGEPIKDTAPFFSIPFTPGCAPMVPRVLKSPCTTKTRPRLRPRCPSISFFPRARNVMIPRPASESAPFTGACAP